MILCEASFCSADSTEVFGNCGFTTMTWECEEGPGNDRGDLENERSNCL